MEWDLGVLGIATLAGMSLGFGLLAYLFAGKDTTRWLWPIASATYFVVGLLTSEAWFGWATEEDLQPNIDGLSFDEVLLFASLAGIAAVMITRHLAKGTKPSRSHSGAASLS